MADRGLKYNRNGGALTYNYTRYNPTTKVAETHRFGLVPCRGVNETPGVSQGVEIKNVQGGVSGTTVTSYSDDKSIIKINGRIYGELYGGSDGVTNSSGDPYYNGGSVGSPLQAERGGYAEGGNPNCTRYAEVNNFVDDNDKSMGTSTYEVWANRILKKAPMHVDYHQNGEVGLKLTDSASNDFIAHNGMVRSLNDDQIEGSKSRWFSYHALKYTLRNTNDYSQLAFRQGDPAKVTVTLASPTTKLKIYSIGSFSWEIERDWVETDIVFTLYNGQGVEIAKHTETGCSGMSGKTSGTVSFDNLNGWETYGGYSITISDTIDKWGKIFLGGVPSSKGNFVVESQPTGRREGYIPCLKETESQVLFWGLADFSGCEFRGDVNGLIRIGVDLAEYVDTDDGWVKALRQPKYNGSEQIYEYIIRFRGIESSWMDWNGNINGSGGEGPDKKDRPTGGFQYDAEHNIAFSFVSDNFVSHMKDRGFVRDAGTGDVYRICENMDDIFKLNGDFNDITYRKNFKLYHFKCSAYYYIDGSDIPVINEKYRDLWTNDRGRVSIVGAEPGTRPGGKHVAWDVYAKNDPIDPEKRKERYKKNDVANIVILGDDAKIVPVFEDTPITINEYFVESYDTDTGMEKYSTTPKEIRGFSEKPVQLDNLDYLPGLPFCEPIGWYSKRYGGGQYITVDEQNRHTFHGNATIYAHYIINTIDGIEWGLCEKKGEIWDWQPPANFTGKDNVFFIGKGETLDIGVRVYPNDISHYGMITKISQSNDMFIMTDIDNASSGKELYRQIVPSNDLTASTLDYMVITAYTNIGMKSQAFVFFVDKVNVTLNTGVTNGTGDTISTETPLADHSDTALTTYYKSKKGRDPKDGDTIDEYGTPYHSIWIYHTSSIDTGEGVKRHWVDMGSPTKTVETTLGRLPDVDAPKRYSFTQNRRIELVFKGWCDAKGTMVADSDGRIIGDDKIFLKNTELFASWVRPEDFTDTDMVVIQRPLSKGDYSRLLQLKLLAPTSCGISYSPSVSATAIPTQTVENAFAFDKKVEQSITLSVTRVSPEPYDNTSDDPDKWSNSKWMEELIGMQNRYQASTDGEKFLYIPIDCGLRRYRCRKTDALGSFYRYTYYGHRYPLVGKCTDAPKGTVDSLYDLTEIQNPQQKDIYYVKNLEQMFIYMVNDDESYHWHLLMGHDTDPTHWNKGFLYTNAYGEKHYYLGRNVYIRKNTPEYSFGSPTIIKFDLRFDVGGIKENEKDVIEW